MVGHVAEHRLQTLASPLRHRVRRPMRREWLAPLAAVLLPAALLLMSGWNSWDAAWREAGTDLTRGADTVAEYARRVFDGHVLRLDRAKDLIAGLTDAQVLAEEPRLHAAFARIAGRGGDGPVALNLTLFDARGHALVSARAMPAQTGIDMSALEQNQALHDPEAAEPHVGAVALAPVSRRALFSITSRRPPSGSLPPGTYEGVLNVAVYADEASEDLRRLDAGAGDVISLLRRDGRILARSLPLTGDVTAARVGADSPIRAAMDRAAARQLLSVRSTLDGQLRLVAYRRVEGWPVYVSVARPRATVIGRWVDVVAWQAVAAIAASAALLLLAAAARRRRQVADAEAARVSVANLALEYRVAERTVALARATRDAEDAVAERSAILAQLAEGVIVADREGSIVFVNEAAGRIHGTAPLGISAEGYAAAYDLLTEEGTPLAPRDLPLARAVRGETVTDARWRIGRPDGAQVLAVGSARPLSDADGRPSGAVLTLRDETSRDSVERALAAREADFRAIFDTAGAGVTQVDLATRRFLRVNRRYCELLRREEDDVLAAGPDGVTHPEDRDPRILAQMAGAADGRFEAEKRLLRGDGSVVWVRISAAVSKRDTDGHPTVSVAVVQDITARRHAERRQALLVAELNHRVKNVLATVQAIASQTMRGAAGDPERFAADFSGRLGVLARAHDLLTANAWESAELAALARSALAPWLGEATGSRMDTAGLEVVWIGPRQAQALVLALHELATNAAKHGALSVPQGRVRLRTCRAEAGMLRLCWTETDGPPLNGPPSRRGFGTRLLERALASDLGPAARVALTFAPEGLRAEITFAPQTGAPE